MIPPLYFNRDSRGLQEVVDSVKEELSSPKDKQMLIIQGLEDYSKVYLIEKNMFAPAQEKATLTYPNFISRNENLNLLVRIKFLNLFIYIYMYI